MNDGVGREWATAPAPVRCSLTSMSPVSSLHTPHPDPHPHLNPGQWGLLWLSDTGDEPAMVQVREWTCPKPQGKWHLQKQYPRILTPLLGVVLLSQKPENLP